MFNYIKSEVYRNMHSKGNHIFLFGGMIFAILLNSILGMQTYGDTNLALTSFYTSMRTIMIICFPLISLIYGQEFKHHTLKNSVSYGISRNQIYFGKFFVEVALCIVNLICISMVYIISAYIILGNTDIIHLLDLIRSLIAFTPLLLVSIAVAHCLYFMFDNEIMVGIVWAIIIVIIPAVLKMVGRRIGILEKIANWTPWNMIDAIGYDEATNRLLMTWSSSTGFIKCFIIGFIGVAIFYTLGLISFKRKEIK
jgi:ABC-2 type transport system permease protein